MTTTVVYFLPLPGRSRIRGGRSGERSTRGRRSGDKSSLDGDPSLLLKITEDRALLAYCIDGAPHVAFGHGVDKLRVLAGALARKGCRADGGLDLLQQAGEVPELSLVNRTLDGAAGRMSHDEDQLGAGDSAGELEAAEGVIVGNVAGHARVEAVANADVEDDLSRARESVQLRIAAAGYWPPAVARFWVR